MGSNLKGKTLLRHYSFEAHVKENQHKELAAYVRERNSLTKVKRTPLSHSVGLVLERFVECSCICWGEHLQNHPGFFMGT